MWSAKACTSSIAHGAAFLDGGAADAAADRDPHAGRLALKRAEDQFVGLAQKVEAGPVRGRAGT